MGATIKRQGVVARTKAWCHPHTGGEDQPDTATTKATKASNNNKGRGNETPAASSVDRRLLPLLRRVMPMEVQEGGSKKIKVPRQGGGNLRILTSKEKQGWPTRAPPRRKNQGCSQQARPGDDDVWSCRGTVSGVSPPRHSPCLT